MSLPDWSDPPTGLTRCLRWLTGNLRLVLEADNEAEWAQAESFCEVWIPELRQELERLRQELVEMGEGPPEQEPFELRFAAANECYFQALDLIEAWLPEPHETALGDIEYQVERGASLLEQADSLNYSVASQNTLEFSG